MRGRRVRTLVAVVVLLTAGCAATEQPAGGQPTQPQRSAEIAQPTSEGDQQRFPDVVRAELKPVGGTWRVTATVSSPYDSPERYADAFRVLDEDGAVLGVRELLHEAVYGERLARDLGTRPVGIRGGKHFAPEDHPDVVAAAIFDVVAQIAA